MTPAAGAEELLEPLTAIVGARNRPDEVRHVLDVLAADKPAVRRRGTGWSWHWPGACAGRAVGSRSIGPRLGPGPRWSCGWSSRPGCARSTR